MNYNFGDQNSLDNEYDLFKNSTEEVINLYGIKIKYLITKKINPDHIFGESTHISVDNKNVYEFYAMPGETDMWGSDGGLFSKFGLQNLDTISLFISRSDMEKIHPELTNREGRATIDNLPNGNLVVFDSNKIMEVTSFELMSADFNRNNIFTSNRDKNVYKITLKSYFANRDDYTNSEGISNSDKVEYEDFGNLESIFNSEEEILKEEEKRAEKIIIKDEVIYPDKVRDNVIRDKEKEKNPFGFLG